MRKSINRLINTNWKGKERDRVEITQVERRRGDRVAAAQDNLTEQQPTPDRFLMKTRAKVV